MTTLAPETDLEQDPENNAENNTVRPPRPAPAPIPLSRIVSVELRKSFDTRSGFWLLASIAITAVIATGAVLLFAPENELTYDTFAAAIGFPIAVILPMIAVLSVTGEWSQRSGLTTFTLVPHRGRTILAKAIVAVAIGVVSMLFAFAVGALGNLVGPALMGTERVWDDGPAVLANIVLGNVLGLLVGFMLGVVIRNSAGAIVAYFVYSFVLTTLSMVLAASQDWFKDLQPWVDFNYASGNLFGDTLTGEQWAQLGVTSVFWLVIPLAVGLRMVLRSEVK
jgi:ABC-2 type transport system permease protein